LIGDTVTSLPRSSSYSGVVLEHTVDRGRWCGEFGERLGLKYVATDRHWPSLAVKIWEVGSAPRGQARTRYFKFCELLEAHQTAKMRYLAIQINREDPPK